MSYEDQFTVKQFNLMDEQDDKVTDVTIAHETSKKQDI